MMKPQSSITNDYGDSHDFMQRRETTTNSISVSLKEACGKKKNAYALKRESNYFEYMDRMQETLNSNIQDNVLPNWRQHPSLKGKARPFLLSHFSLRLAKYQLPFDIPEPQHMPHQEE